jgi:argininosuccinate lyase
MTLWSGRFDTEPDPAAFDFGISFGFDRALFADDITGSIAWAEALGAAGVLSRDDAAAIIRALEAILEEGQRNPAWVSGPDEDVHSFVERRLVERVGDAGRRLHTGRSRNEQVSLDLRLYLRRRIPVLQRAVAALVAACADQAASAGSTLMPSYTHLRRAQPVLVAHFFLSHAAALRRDHPRLGGAADEADALPLGSGAVAGTSYPIDTEALARRLGFSRVVPNSIDASSDRDFVASFLYATALSMVHLSRIAEDLIIFTGEEHGFFELSDASATGSSMMPQKKNPDPLELVRGKTGRAIGHLAGWLATVKGLPSGYNKDLQEDKEAVFDAERTLAASLAATEAVVSRLTLNAARSERASSGLLLATDVADYLVARGMPFRRAHEVVGAMVRRLLAEGRDFSSLTLTEWRDASEMFGEDAPQAATALASVRARRTPQSTNPDAVQAALAECRTWLTQWSGAQGVPGVSTASGHGRPCT